MRTTITILLLTLTQVTLAMDPPAPAGASPTRSGAPAQTAAPLSPQAAPQPQGDGDPTALSLSLAAEENHRIAAAKRLGELKVASPDVIATLLRLADDRDRSVRRAAVVALGELGPAAKVALPTIKYLLGYEKDNQGNREAAILALLAIDPAVTHWRPEFAALIFESDHSSGRSWAFAFRKTVEAHPELRDAHLALLDDFDPTVKAAAASAIATAAVPLPGADTRMARLLGSDEPLVRWNGAMALARVSTDKTKAAEQLRPFLKDPDARVRLAAGIGLISLKQQSKDVFAVLASSLAEMTPPDDDDPARVVAISAMDALADQDPNTREALLALQRIARAAGDRRETKYLKDFAYGKMDPLERKLRDEKQEQKEDQPMRKRTEQE